jgi:hypothetical protein
MTGSEPEFQVPLPMPLDGHSGPAPRLSGEQANAMLGAALLEFDRLHPAHAGQAPSKLWAAPKTWAVAASTLLALAGSAAAARYYFHFGEPAPVTRVAPAPSKLPVQPPPAQLQPAPTQPTSSEVQPESAVAPHASATPRPDRDTERSNRAAVRGAPEDLLQKANHQRALGQFADAAQTYALVYERFPRSVSAYVARVAAGAIELEHLSNPTLARKLFDQALREQPRGALDLEARQGLSVALRDLEDRTGEREALKALVARHPDSPAARRAQVRLREIGGE